MIDSFFLCLLGVGKSKKLAKRNAANAMLILLKQGMTVPQVDTEHTGEFDDENIPLVSIRPRRVPPCWLLVWLLGL